MELPAICQFSQQAAASACRVGYDNSILNRIGAGRNQKKFDAVRVSQVGFRNRARGRKEQRPPETPMANQSISRNQVLAVSLLALAANLHAQSAGSVTNRVLAYFDHLSKEQHLDQFLKRARPTPVSMGYKAAALAKLPPNARAGTRMVLG